MSEYRIDFSIMYKPPGQDDFSELGFGSTLETESLGEAAHQVLGAVHNDEWDRTDD